MTSGLDLDKIRRSAEPGAMFGAIIVRDLVDRLEQAEAQAKLESEALRLANEFYGSDWDFFPCSRTAEMQQWLAVARRAREMGAEK